MMKRDLHEKWKKFDVDKYSDELTKKIFKELLGINIKSPYEYRVELEKKLKKLVDRRNKIAHEGDLSQSKKARNKSRELKPDDVEKAIAFVRDIVEKSEVIINDQLGLQRG